MASLSEIDTQCLSFGYVREFIMKSNMEKFYIIPHEIYQLIYTFYGKSYIIYGVGRNECGELGLGHCLKVRNYMELSRFSSLCDSPKSIYPQWKKFYIKNELNEIYYAGFDYITNEFISEFSRLILFKNMDKNSSLNIKLISNGLQGNHTFFIVENMENNDLNIFVLGNNYKGQFGIGGMARKYETIYIHNVTQRMNTFIFGSINNIKEIKCGSNHTLFLTKNGLIYSCGSNTFSQCGFESIDNDRIYYPKLIEIKQKKYDKNGNEIYEEIKMIQIAVGSNHNLCISNDYKLYVFGWNEYGQIGPKWTENDNDEYNKNDNDENNEIDPDATTMLLPSRNQIIRPKIHKYFASNDNIKIKLIECGSDYSLCIDFNGNCWLFGDNRCGQIGCNRNNENIDIPFLIQSYKHLKDIKFKYGSCGYSHSILLSTKEPQQNIYVFGCNLHCECSSIINNKKKIKFIDYPYLLNKNEIFGINHKQYTINHIIAARCSTLIICEK